LRNLSLVILVGIANRDFYHRAHSRLGARGTFHTRPVDIMRNFLVALVAMTFCSARLCSAVLTPIAGSTTTGVRHAPRCGLMMMRGSSMPEEVLNLLPVAAKEQIPSVLPLWKAVRACYPSDTAAVVALQRNRGLLLPWVSSPSSITGNHAVLVKMCGKEQTLQIISKNPGTIIGHVGV
jgi:hypothetical protein